MLKQAKKHILKGDFIMKKIIALMLALVMALGLFAACGATEQEKTQATPAATNATEDTVAAPTFTTVTEGKLTMATNAYFPPYEYYDGDKIIGIDAEIAAAIAAELGLELEIKDMQFDSIITSVKEEKSTAHRTLMSGPLVYGFTPTSSI